MSRTRNILDFRDGHRIHAEWGHVGVLEGGGHICELRLTDIPDINPLWRPQWTTIDPDRYSPLLHKKIYGPPPDARLLAGLAGHSVSFDHFGPPSKEETAAGLSTHGEAPALRWKSLGGRKPPGHERSLVYGCRLERAQIDFQRKITVDPHNPIIYCEEIAENLCSYDRPISWNEHVTFGPPFLACGTTIFDMPATRGRVCAPEYSERTYLKPDSEFLWPNAPRKDGCNSNLRTTPEEVFGHYTAQLIDPGLEIAFVSACNPLQGMLVVYVYRRTDFPWIGNWEERYNRTSAPWNGKTFCRGIEFSTTPFAIPRRETIDQGRLFGESTYRWLSAKSRASVRFLILLFRVPDDFAGVATVTSNGALVTVAEAGSLNRFLSVKTTEFLGPLRTAKQ